MDLTARKQICNEMKPYLTDISYGYLRVMTCRARKINKLFGTSHSKTTTSDHQSHVNEISETVATTSAHDSDDNFSNTLVTDYFKSDNESNSDANKSDSDVYFKSDDFDSDVEYDHELHERIMHEEMAQLAKLEEKTPDDFIDYFPDEEHETYFDDPAPGECLEELLGESITL
ncbi:hypothetical protein RclHR1_21070003 [Rhizophagus clarus]|uniref:Uncharacterized protein n=1 Tax=Rhizophagus clarus TaxID=94130 RepID=A0A2Z6RL91_9GLOM|nr:hypothetical protein RclHR1_21070003 [Rhizophagus clarus]